MIEKDLWGFNVIGKQGVDAKNDFAVNPTANGTDISVRFNNTEISGAQFATLKEIAEGGGTGVSNYNDLTNIPIINADLEAENFVPVAGKYYRHVVAGGPQPAGTPIVAGVTSLYVDKEFTGQAMKDYLASLSYPYTPGTGLAMCKFFDTTFGDYVGYWGAGYAEFEGQSAYLMGFFDAESSELLSVLWASIEATGVEEPMNWCDPIRESADGKLSENVTVSNIQSGDWNGKVFSSTQFVTSTFVDGTIYQCTAASPAAYAQVLTSADSVGTQVIANPGGVLSANLQSIAINGVSYGIAAGGSAVKHFTATFGEEVEDYIFELNITDADIAEIKTLVHANNFDFDICVTDPDDIFDKTLTYILIPGNYNHGSNGGSGSTETIYDNLTLHTCGAIDGSAIEQVLLWINFETEGWSGPSNVLVIKAEHRPVELHAGSGIQIQQDDNEYTISATGGSSSGMMVDLGEYLVEKVQSGSTTIQRWAAGQEAPSIQAIEAAVAAGKIPVIRTKMQSTSGSTTVTATYALPFTSKKETVIAGYHPEITYMFATISGGTGGSGILAYKYIDESSTTVVDWDIML